MFKYVHFMNFSALDRLQKFSFTPWIPLVGAVIAHMAARDWLPELIIVTLPAIILAALWAFNSVQKSAARNSKIMQEWASQNNMRYAAEPHQFAMGPGSLFTDPRQSITNAFEGTLIDKPFYLAHYKRPQGKTEFYATVMCVQLPRRLPHIVIDSHMEGDGFTSVLAPVFATSQRMELEGDFAQYFTVYAPAGYEASALNILAPDIMLKLMQFGVKCDIEIIDDRLYFYWPFLANKRSEFEELFETTQAIVTATDDKLVRSDIYKQPEHKMQVAAGVRIQKGHSWRAYVTPLSLIAAGASIAVNMVINQKFDEESVLQYVVWACIWGALVITIDQITRPRRLRKEYERRFGKK